MPTASFSLDDRIQQLREFESEHGHMLVPQEYKTGGVALGTWVKNTRANRRKSKLDADIFAKLDEIGFVWDAPKGPEKDALIEWGKQFKLLVNYHKTKGHCSVPSKVAGQSNPLAVWCDEQRALNMNGKLEQEKLDKLRKLDFDFFPEDEPALKRQRTSGEALEMPALEKDIWEGIQTKVREEIQATVREEIKKVVQEEIKAMKQELLQDLTNELKKE